MSRSLNDGGIGSLRFANAPASRGAGFAFAVSNANGLPFEHRRPAASLRPRPQCGAM